MDAGLAVAIGAFAVACIAAIGAFYAEPRRRRKELDAQRSELSAQGAALQRVTEATEGLRLDLAAARKAEQLGAAQRDLRGALYREYILSHDGISSAIMAETEALPDAWVGAKLREWGFPDVENPTRPRRWGVAG